MAFISAISNSPLSTCPLPSASNILNKLATCTTQHTHALCQGTKELRRASSLTTIMLRGYFNKMHPGNSMHHLHTAQPKPQPVASSLEFLHRYVSTLSTCQTNKHHSRQGQQQILPLQPWHTTFVIIHKNFDKDFQRKFTQGERRNKSAIALLSHTYIVPVNGFKYIKKCLERNAVKTTSGSHCVKKNCQSVTIVVSTLLLLPIPCLHACVIFSLLLDSTFPLLRLR